MTYRALFKFNKRNTQNISTNHTAGEGYEEFRLKVKKFIEEEAADEYNGDTVGMYIGGTLGTLMMVAVILIGGM